MVDIQIEEYIEECIVVIAVITSDLVLNLNIQVFRNTFVRRESDRWLQEIADI